METNWRDQYPLSTFTGETKKELIDFIENQISAAEQRVAKEITEKIVRIKEMVEEVNGTSKYDSCYDDCLLVVEETVNKPLE